MKMVLPSDTSIKYGVRHYMHGDCYVLSGKPFALLSAYQAGQLPYRAVKDAGRIDELLKVAKFDEADA